MAGGESLEQFAESLQGSAPRRLRSVPDYIEIVRGSRWLGMIGGLYLVMGWLLVVVVIAGIGVRLVLIAMKKGDLNSLMDDWPEIATTFGTGLFLICVGSLVCMVRSLSLAVRDIAQNSFYK